MRYKYTTCPCGPIKGIEADNYLLYKSICYANAERWESPKEITSWEGTYDATFPGAWCPQRATYAKSTITGQFYVNENVEKQAIIYREKCLMLNIWTPVHAENAPVLVYIHGGGYETGGGSAQNFCGQTYCENGVILVTINYRLNVFASALDADHTGNYGLQDQVCALQWIQHNIAAFGGDPNRVTIMGESAGAMSVQNLIYTPLAKGLFHRAIMLSGGGILPKQFSIKTPEAILELWQKVCQALGATNLEQLKETDPETLFLTWLTTYASDPKYAQPATPVIDGITIPAHPATLAEEGKINAVPTIISLLSEDMWPHDLYTTALDWGQRMAATGQPPVYGMYFDRPIPDTDLGAYHGCDLRYVFNAFHTSWRSYDETDFRICRDIMNYFISFIKTGVPQTPELPTWEPISATQTRFMHFGNEPSGMCDVPADRLLATQKKGKPFPGM